jgi:hypothetical protein
VCKILKSISTYFNIPRILNKETIDRIASIYFTHAMRGAPPPSLLTTLVQADEKARPKGMGAHEGGAKPPLEARKPEAAAPAAASGDTF